MALSSSSHHNETEQELWSDMVFRSLYPSEEYALFTKTLFEKEFLPEFSSPCSTRHIPFISYDSVPPENMWRLPKPSNNSYTCNFPLQDTPLSHNLSTKPHQDITDEDVYIDAAGMPNITCDAGSNKPAVDGGSIKPSGDVRSINDSFHACYLCGEAEHFARKCSLGCDCGNSTT
ncbi:hypothetical protein POM88_027620 [Heracleum sosnowskyi]|uniref:CCHC-type domain-containing protein n=1 Tax=Heracleum sosnowskyi TaxID=360622 RepID=A0AAD8I8A4_9APIA|nr:hypothetical protein POM88_027614 [Heracleum sosnowskyi]KAK1380871.1 hypothetical protein POM88_027615 [Heracleum sosnowskyi]KAK1380872.1 hypothetical protein POM88_027616 [Heracleum sosnowskyi]KAK1380874.1 hypothetical protein POM88_027618 [Heracleum sosnowskyi]KAK1380875.1 hypothetical protein POM88_027619 [Heracleum sosnowskyi]